MANLPNKEKLQGNFVNLREVTIDDVEFILNLRCNQKKSKFLHKTEYNIEKQVNYIKNYLKKDDEWYFIIENKEHKPLGTIRIYDVKGKQYTGGSWLMVDEASPSEVLEGSLLLKNYAFNVLGFEKDCFDVRKENKKVVRFHKICGAKIVNENDIDYFFELTKETFENNKKLMYGILGE